MVITAFAFKVERRLESSSFVSNLQQNSIVPVSAQPKDTIKKNRDVAMLVLEKTATFNGKDLFAFSEYVAKNIKYPEVAVKNKLEGKVYIQFVVDVDGQVRDATVLRGASPLLNEEAVRVVKSSPAWTPAQDKGVVVKQLFTLPVVFSLKDKN